MHTYKKVGKTVETAANKEWVQRHNSKKHNSKQAQLSFLSDMSKKWNSEHIFFTKKERYLYSRCMFIIKLPPQVVDLHHGAVSYS